MSTGKHLSLEEARKQGKLDRFAKEHEAKADKEAFEELLDRMAKNLPTSDQTSKKD
jgi:stalled ribosome rescue protein Dom34